MPRRPCLQCGELTRGSYCEAHDPERQRRRDTPGRGGGYAASAFREAVLARAGFRCEAIEDGVRCDVTDRSQLEAHHVQAIVAGGNARDPANGACLCRRHHRVLEPMARKA